MTADPTALDATTVTALRGCLSRCETLRLQARGTVNLVSRLIDDIEQVLAPISYPAGDLFGDFENVAPAPRVRKSSREASVPKRELSPPVEMSAIDQISEAFGLVGKHKIVRITRTGSEPYSYAIELGSGCIQLGPITNLLRPKALQAKIAAKVGRVIPSFKRNVEWSAIQQLLLDACVELPAAGREATGGSVDNWLRKYVAARTVMGSIDEADATRSPFRRRAQVYLYLGDFCRWLCTAETGRPRRVTPKELGRMMRRAGAEPAKIPCGKSSRQVWLLPSTYGFGADPL